MADTVHCRGLTLHVRIGFHEYERKIRQAIRVDVSVETDFRQGPSRDVHTGLVDYYKLTRALVTHTNDKAYDLLEALTEDLARQVLKAHPSVRVRVCATKNPLDMPEVREVAVEIVRSASDFAAEGAL